MPFSKLLIPFVSLVVVEAALDNKDPGNYCIKSSYQSTSEFCCSGECIDHTIILWSGQCKWFGDACLDASPPSCGDTSVFQLTTWEWETVGGNCYYDECQWQRFNYGYECCPCPDGYKTTGNTCVHRGRGCVGCTDSSETLQINPLSGNYICHGEDWQDKACELEQQVLDWINIAGEANTVLNGLCAGADPASFAINALQAVIAMLNDVNSGHTRGLAGSTMVAALNVAAMASALYIGLELAEAAALVNKMYQTACKASTMLGAALDNAEEALGDFHDYTCPASQQKRELDGPEHLQNRTASPRPQRRHIQDRDDQYNPCTAFLSTVPPGLDTIDTLWNASTYMRFYTADDTLSPPIANALVPIQAWRENDDVGGNQTVMHRFIRFINALPDIEPFCGSYYADMQADPSATGTETVSVASTTAYGYFPENPTFPLVLTYPGFTTTLYSFPVFPTTVYGSIDSETDTATDSGSLSSSTDVPTFASMPEVSASPSLPPGDPSASLDASPTSDSVATPDTTQPASTQIDVTSTTSSTSDSISTPDTTEPASTQQDSTSTTFSSSSASRTRSCETQMWAAGPKTFCHDEL